jgi:glycerol-3-phosphate dehydrogenase
VSARGATIRYSRVIRDLSRLTAREFDVLIVGGGIHGLTIAYDAAQRGLSVALVERGDFGAATSFNHLKTIHGGLRYLQTGDLRRMRESIRERHAFARIAPRFVSPLPFAMPTGRPLTRTAVVMKAAFAIDAFIGRNRNEGLAPAHHLPAGGIIVGSECRALFDGAISNVASAAVWHDLLTVDGDRLTSSFAKAAVNHGATIVNYTEAIAPLDRLTRARDTITGDILEIRSRVVINAAGPWSGTLLDTSGGGTSWRLLKAMNLVTSRAQRKAALVASTKEGRGLVLLPWRGRTLVGTSESREERGPDDQDAKRSEVDAFLAEVNATFPALGLKPSEITLVHRGVVPATTKNGRLTLLGHSRIIDRSQPGSVPLISVVGVKYTTARAVAERVVDLALTRLGRSLVECRTAATVLPEASLDDLDPPDPVSHAIREEMAVTLTDVVVRRTGIGAAGYPGDEASKTVADRMQAELGWSDERKSAELEALRRFYEIR